MLKRVSIQNFKSLKDVTLDLQKINLLIGPNNSGKTNFLKALEFCSTYRELKAHQYEALTFEKKLSNRFKIELFGTSDITEYDFIINKYFLSDGYTVEGSRGYYKHSQPDAVIRPNSFDVAAIQLSSLVCNIYKPDPNKFTKPGPVGTGEELVNADASNLIGFLDRMLGNKYRKIVFNRIEDDLHGCVPEFDQIELDDAVATEEFIRFHGEDSRKRSFKRLGLSNSKQGVTYWADELSEGTLYFLALLCIINQPNPPKLLLLEEPEKGIHPRRIFEVIQFILELVEEKDVQVVMTTHSPIVVDMFKDMPESVFIFDKDEEGATHVKNLQRDVIEPETAKSEELGLEPPHYTDSLGNAWTVGFLGGVPR